jgi:hypothetical protein
MVDQRIVLPMLLLVFMESPRSCHVSIRRKGDFLGGGDHSKFEENADERAAVIEDLLPDQGEAITCC